MQVAFAQETGQISLLVLQRVATFGLESSKGKSLSEALIFVSTNPQYDDRLFIESQVQYIKIPSSEHGENMMCIEIVFDIHNNLCTQHVLPMFCKNKSF